MKILLVENALDSLRWALVHLSSFLEMDEEFENPDESTTYLKQAIITLNSSLELFFKEAICRINPLLICKGEFSEGPSDEILEYFVVKENDSEQIPFYDYIVGKNKIYTIDYSKCIELYGKIFSVPCELISDLKELNNYRNQLMHLGINNKEEYYILAGRLDRILFFIQNSILERLDYEQEIIDDIRCNILGIETKLAAVEDSIWRQLNYEKIEKVCLDFDRLFKSKEIQEYLKQKDISAEYGPTLDAAFSYGIFLLKKGSTDIEFASIYTKPKRNCLLITDTDNKNGPIYGVIVLSKDSILPERIYVSRDEDGTCIDNFENIDQFWSGEYKGAFNRLDYADRHIQNMIKIIINSMESMEFTDFEGNEIDFSSR